MTDGLPTATAPEMLPTIDACMAGYSTILCDVWGVLHNGARAFEPACRAMQRAREAGKSVVLITNAPRPWRPIADQMRGLGVPDDAWDRIVTSGDVTRDLVARGPRRIFHLGPERDMPLYDGLDVELVEEAQASAVVCTGLVDDETETPEDYAAMLRRFHDRDLAMVCANPDIVVERGDKLVWCAGALARDYDRLGGRTMIAGKPHSPIYRAALEAASSARGAPVTTADILAIGDGIATDIKGATDAGIDALFVSGGIHFRDYGDSPSNPDPERLAAFLESNGLTPRAVMTRLA